MSSEFIDWPDLPEELTDADIEAAVVGMDDAQLLAALRLCEWLVRGVSPDHAQTLLRLVNDEVDGRAFYTE